MQIKYHVSDKKQLAKKCLILSLDWLIERCLQVYLSDLTQSSLHLRLQQKLLSEKNLNKKIEQILDIHTYLISKKVFSYNWTK
jgi:hypothetical protein